MVRAEEVCSIVTAVRRAYQRVHMVTGRLSNIKNHPRVVIKLDQHDGAMNSEVENRIVTRPAEPRKPSVVEVLHNFFHPDLGMAVTGPADKGGDQFDQQIALDGRKFNGSDSLIRQDGVVAKCPGLRAAIEWVLKFR
jgi:hypothetical protein